MKDATRFRKTYSYFKSEKQTLTTVTVNGRQYDSRDLTRFKKTYSFTRQSPVQTIEGAIVAATSYPVGPFMWITADATANRLLRITPWYGNRSILDLVNEAQFSYGQAIDSSATPYIYGSNRGTEYDVMCYDPVIRATRPGHIFNGDKQYHLGAPLSVPGYGIWWGRNGSFNTYAIMSTPNPNIDILTSITMSLSAAILARFAPNIYDPTTERVFAMCTNGGNPHALIRVNPATPNSFEAARNNSLFNVNAGIAHPGLALRNPNNGPTTEILVGGNNSTIFRINPATLTIIQQQSFGGGTDELRSIAYDPIRDTIWASSYFDQKIYVINASNLTLISSISIGSRPSLMFYEPYIKSAFGESGDRIWTVYESNPYTINAFFPTSPPTIEQTLSLSASVSINNTFNKCIYSPAGMFPNNKVGDSILDPLTWPISGSTTNSGSIIAGYWKAGSHNEIDVATNRVNRIIDLSGNGLHFIPSGSDNAKRVLHVATESTASGGKSCFRFQRDGAHMVAENWTLANVVYDSRNPSAFQAGDEYAWFIVYRQKSWPVGSEALFGVFSDTSKVIGFAPYTASSGSLLGIRYYEGDGIAKNDVRGTASPQSFVWGGWIAKSARIDGNRRSYYQSERGTTVWHAGVNNLNLSGSIEIGNTQNSGSFTQSDADVYEIYLLRRMAWDASLIAPRYFDRYTRYVYNT